MLLHADTDQSCRLTRFQAGGVKVVDLCYLIFDPGVHGQYPICLRCNLEGPQLISLL